MTAGNVHEAAARTMKVFRLAGAVEQALPGQDPGDVARGLGTLDEATWVKLADAAGVRPPGVETRRLVVVFFEEKAKAAKLLDPFAGLPGADQ